MVNPMRVKTLLMGLMMCSVLGLTACDDEYHDHHDSGHYYEEPPRLYSANMVDTYYTNSEFEYTHLAVSPYINDGEFEIFWDMHSEGEFFTEIRVNNINSTVGSLLVSSDWCSAYSDCYDHQYQYCEYSSDFYVFCETPAGSLQAAYVGDLIAEIPQDLYFIVQVCDTSYMHCEYETMPVSMQ